MFILSSISTGLEFLTVNHASIAWNSELNSFKKIKVLEKFLVID